MDIHIALLPASQEQLHSAQQSNPIACNSNYIIVRMLSRHLFSDQALMPLMLQKYGVPRVKMMRYSAYLYLHSVS